MNLIVINGRDAQYSHSECIILGGKLSLFGEANLAGDTRCGLHAQDVEDDLF